MGTRTARATPVPLSEPDRTELPPTFEQRYRPLVAQSEDQSPDEDLRVVIVDPKDIPPASLARIRAHAKQLAIQLARNKPA